MTVPAGDLRAAVASMMAAHGREGGYTAPHGSVYPWQWLWDSCFHSLIWAELGDGERAVVELTNVLAVQDELGFVPHMTYHGDPGARADFWGRAGTSSITQPPVYGHAVADLVRRGVAVPDEVVERATDGVRFLLGHRARTADGLVTVVHPWETGCDDSPRWDGWCPGGYERARFREVKGELLAVVEWSEGGAPLANPAFAVASAGFNALLAWNALELSDLTGDDGLVTAAAALADALDGQWSADLATWTDHGPHASGAVRTADALLPTLLATRDRDDAFAALGDGSGLGGPFGAAGTDRREPTYDPTAYWRGPVWPQVTYLLWVAASRAGHPVAGDLAAGLRAGALTSGLAEYWHPDTAAPGGAVPQSWSGLALLV
ncbi:MAG TPA: hypothetical protein VIT24_03275 [Acidimicrobiales bacterium]